MKHDTTRDLRLAMALNRITRTFSAEDALMFGRLEEYNPLPFELRPTIRALGVIGAHLSLNGELDYDALRKALAGKLIIDSNGEREQVHIIDYALSTLDEDEGDVLSVNDMVDNIAEAFCFSFSINNVTQKELADAIWQNNSKVLHKAGETIDKLIKKHKFVDCFLCAADDILTELVHIMEEAEYQTFFGDRPEDGDYSEVATYEGLLHCEYSYEGFAEVLNLLLPILFAMIGHGSPDLISFLERINLAGICKKYRQQGAAFYGEYEDVESLEEGFAGASEHFLRVAEYVPVPDIYPMISKVLYHEFYEELKPLKYCAAKSALIIQMTPEEFLERLRNKDLSGIIPPM